EVLNRASSKARQLVDTLQQFSATEEVEHYELRKNGKAQAPKTAHFSYAVEIHDVPATKFLYVEEYRNGRPGETEFPTNLATKGLPAFALIFHPDYIGDFSMICEGLAEIHGRSAWQVRFVQQRANRFRGYTVRNRWRPVKLQGRAWIAADGSVLRLDSELVEPVPEIQLKQDHVTIDYRPVEFPKHNVQLWLPEMAEVTIDLRGHSYRQRHAFRDFQLFWVETGEKRKEPELPPEEKQ
ncbi:MAG: hypothetical protein JO187_06425, partial [Acidobacteria bacterium]|nr:hypothetical protein [Acidobacteriota bacterium]